jgi:hypothetical protein
VGLSEILGYITPETAMGALVMALVGLAAFWRELIFTRAAYRREQREKRFWQRTAWVALGLAKQNVPEVPSFDFDEPEREL